MNPRRLLRVVLCALVVGPGYLYAQEPPAQEPRNAISVDVFMPVMSPVSRLAYNEKPFVPLNVKYQRALTDQWILMVKMGLNYSWDSGKERILDIYPMLAFDWHPFRTGLKGFYLGPSLLFSSSTHFYSGTTAGSDLDYGYLAAVGGNIGYEFVLPARVVIDLTFGLGGGYLKEVDLKGRTSASGFQFNETIGGVFVGYCF